MFSRRTALSSRRILQTGVTQALSDRPPRRPSDRLQVSTFARRPTLPAARPRIVAASDAWCRGPSGLSVERSAPPPRSRASPSALATRAHLRDSRSSPRVPDWQDLVPWARRILPNLPPCRPSEARPYGLHDPVLAPRNPAPCRSLACPQDAEPLGKRASSVPSSIYRQAIPRQGPHHLAKMPPVPISPCQISPYSVFRPNRNARSHIPAHATTPAPQPDPPPSTTSSAPQPPKRLRSLHT